MNSYSSKLFLFNFCLNFCNVNRVDVLGGLVKFYLMCPTIKITELNKFSLFCLNKNKNICSNFIPQFACIWVIPYHLQKNNTITVTVGLKLTKSWGRLLSNLWRKTNPTCLMGGEFWIYVRRRMCLKKNGFVYFMIKLTINRNKTGQKLR